jgi:hypothetical protein
VDRGEWQALAEERILAAQALLAAKQWSSAYYLAGYAVEFGLKSCVLVQVAKNLGVIFQDRKFSDKCFSHNIDDLVRLAGLEVVKNADTAVNPVLAENWLDVGKWSEKSRYEQKTQAQAEKLYHAITEVTNGVMPWIRMRW